MQVLTNMTKAFASLAGLAEKKISFIKLSANEYAFTAGGDPNTGVIVGDDEIRVIDAKTTLKTARGTVFHDISQCRVKARPDLAQHGFQSEMAI